MSPHHTKEAHTMELWDLYTRDRIPTGETHERGKPLPEGL